MSYICLRKGEDDENADLKLGFLIGKRITPTDLPQTVAALHSVVGLAAVLTSIGSVMSGLEHATTLHLVTAYLGVLIGKFPTYDA